jgi:hypothetical protein
MNSEQSKLWLEDLHKRRERNDTVRSAIREALACMTSIAHVEAMHHTTGQRNVVSFDMEKEWQHEVDGLRAALALLED